MFSNLLNFILFINTVVIGQELTNKYDEEIDSVITLLLNGDFELEQPVENGKEDGQPIFDDGIWKCGICDVVDDSKLIYSETNEVNNVASNQPLVVQVGLSIENAQCITIGAGADSKVQKESGNCAGDEVTISVINSSRFTVNVYQ